MLERRLKYATAIGQAAGADALRVAGVPFKEEGLDLLIQVAEDEAPPKKPLRRFVVREVEGYGDRLYLASDESVRVVFERELG